MSDAEGWLRPTAHYLRPRQREQHVDSRREAYRSRTRSAGSPRHHRHVPPSLRADRRAAPLEPPARHDAQHVQHVSRACVGQRHAMRVDAIAFVDEDKVHGSVSVSVHVAGMLIGSEKWQRPTAFRAVSFQRVRSERLFELAEHVGLAEPQVAIEKTTARRRRSLRLSVARGVPPFRR